MNAQDTANNILVDLDGERQRDLLGNSGTAPVGITPFHFNDGVNEFFVRSLRAGPPTARGRKQHAVLSFHQHVVEMQQSGRLQNDGGAENACRAHEEGAQTGEDTIRGAQIGRTLAAAIEDPQLMFDEHRLGNDGTEASWPCQPDYGDDQMNEKHDNIAHPGMLSKPEKSLIVAQFSNSPLSGRGLGQAARRCRRGQRDARPACRCKSLEKWQLAFSCPTHH
jgi:hypothetical protein